MKSAEYLNRLIKLTQLNIYEHLCIIFAYCDWDMEANLIEERV